MASRYAYRARQAVEILDVVGEQTIRGEGPLHSCARNFQAQRLSLISPGRMVITSSSSMSQKDGELVDRFAQGSDGALERYRPYYKPVFTASVGSEGQLDIQTPKSSTSQGQLSRLRMVSGIKSTTSITTA